MKHIIIALVLLTATQFAFGDLLFTETFSYADGSLTGVSSGAWSRYSGTDDPGTPTVSSGHAVVDRGDSDDVGRTFFSAGASNAGSVYVKFDLNMTTAPASLATGYNFFGLGQGTTTLRDRLYVTTDGVTGGDYRIGCGNNSAGVWWASDLDLDTTYSLVLRSDLDSDTTYLWIDAASEGDTSVNVTDADTYAVDSVKLRQSTGIGIMNIDNMLVGTSFGDVIPEPTTFALLSLSLGMLALYRRKK